jgi:hypothetical protein
MTMTKRAQLISLAAIAALSLFNGAARADDGGSSYDDFPLSVSDNGIRYESEAPGPCAESKDDAWFARQLALTEGDSAPAVAALQCRVDGDGDMVAAAGEQDE